VKSAVWDTHSQRGSGDSQAAHIIAGGLYIAHRPDDRKFGPLLRQGYEEDKNAYLITPMYEAALSPQGRRLISSQMTAATVLPTIVDRVELAAESTRGRQLPLTAGEKTALEHAVSFVKMSAPGRTPAEISCLAMEQTKQVCAAVARKLIGGDAEIRSAERRLTGLQLEAVQLRRYLIDLKLSVVTKPERSVDRGTLSREATLLHEYEVQAESDHRYATEKAAEFL
jgi:hypothetical protein